PEPIDLQTLDAPHFPPVLDLFRVEWERAAWQHAGRPEDEARAKADLLRWRLHALVAELSGALAHHYEAVRARPDLPNTRTALGAALLRERRAGEAVEQLSLALTADPLDSETARNLYHALGETDDSPGQLRLARERRLLARAAPQLFPP